MSTGATSSALAVSAADFFANVPGKLLKGFTYLNRQSHQKLLSGGEEGVGGWGWRCMRSMEGCVGGLGKGGSMRSGKACGRGGRGRVSMGQEGSRRSWKGGGRSGQRAEGGHALGPFKVS